MPYLEIQYSFSWFFVVNVAYPPGKPRLQSTYTMLTDLEAVFRSFESELGMRPVYHQKTERVEGHIFICRSSDLT